MGDGAPVLTVRGLAKRYGTLPVLRDVSFDVAAGEIVALVGENGAGKSTVVRCITNDVDADAGAVSVFGGSARDHHDALAVVWQDLALCDNLSVVANIFLGDERLSRRMLDDRGMVTEARRLFARLNLPPIDLQAPVGNLSGGQRQLVAIARAVRRGPPVLILDEPSASLGVNETRFVERMLVQLRDEGAAVLLLSHRLDQVFALADRIAILRDGCIAAQVSPFEVHPDDVVALMAGVKTDSTARRQLRRLGGLVEQLADVEPNASLPLILSALADALDIEQLCIHVLTAADPPQLTCSAAIGLSHELLAEIDVVTPGDDGGSIARAAATCDTVVVESHASGGRHSSSWSVPVVGSGDVLGTISGFSETSGRPRDDQLALVRLYASLAAAAIERERLLADATRRNRVLETLRGVLDTLAGPVAGERGLHVALVALCRGLGADAIALHQHDGPSAHLTPSELGDVAAGVSKAHQEAAAEVVLRSTTRLDRARPVGPDVLAVPIAAPDGRAVVTAWWADRSRLSNDALDLLDDAARSIQLALERQALDRANAETASLRRSQRLQRDFLSRLNHELRTPLTAIQGYASTLRQQDVSWDMTSQERFLDSIASESARMGRLVGDLLDFSAIESGTLRLVSDWCDLGLVLNAAHRCVADAPTSLVDVDEYLELPPIWADHDRLEQVFVNLLDNALRHAAGATRISISAAVDEARDAVTVRVADDGAGIPARVADRVFLAHERGPTSGPGAGLGLAIARGIVEAHGGRISFAPSARGTTVVVVLPIEPANEPEGEDAARLASTPSPAP